MSELRINARLDEQTANDLQFLREELGDKSITEVLKLSLQQLAQEHRERQKARQQKQIWRESGFIGAHDGPEDLAGNYKQHLTDMLNEKYPAGK